MNRYSFRRNAMEDEQEYVDERRIITLEQDLHERREMQQTFHSQGWPYVAQRLQDGITAAKELITTGAFEDDPKGSAFVRGQIRSYETLLNLPAQVEQEIYMAEQELETERPS